MTMHVKDAIKTAFDYAKEYEEFLSPERGLTSLRLEEVEYNDSGNEWKITLGFNTGATRRRASGATLMQETITEPEREFRTFVLNDTTGEIKKIERG